MKTTREYIRILSTWMAPTPKPKKPIKETFAGHRLSALNVQHRPDRPHERIGRERFAQKTVEMRRNFLQLGQRHPIEFARHGETGSGQKPGETVSPGEEKRVGGSAFREARN